MMKKFCIFLMSLVPVSVLAGFQVVDDGATSKPVAEATQAPTAAGKTKGGFQFVSLIYIDEAEADIPVVNGFGRELKLLDAIKQIAPAGWQVFLNEDVASRAANVSWKGGRRWVEVLDILGNDQSLSIEVSWKRKYLFVGPKKPTSAAASAVVAPIDAAATASWKIRAGEKISEAFARWAKSAGWQLAWEAPDLISQADIDLDATFEEAIGKVIDALNRSGGGLQAKFYASNHVLRILEKK